MIKQRKIELLAPAKNMECGIEAINHGADAVYIGDSEVDVQTAINAGLDSVIVLWGFRERELLEQYGAKVFAQDTKECLRLLQ